ncbi:MAG: sensor histidine kinase [Actinomycetes bacterium]
MYGGAGTVAVLGGLGAAAGHAVNAAAGRAIEPSFWLMQVASAVGYGLLTLVLRDRATTALRLTVAGIGLGSASAVVAYEWSMWDRDAVWVAWYASWAWSPGYLAILALLPLLLPDGTLVSPRWRPAVGWGLLAVVLVGASWAVWPYEDQDHPEMLSQTTNPVGLELASDPWFSTAVDAVLVSSVLLALASLVVRWRRSRDLRRRQLKWLLLGLLGTVLLVVVARLAPVSVGVAVSAAAMLPIPAAIGVAVLRHELWDVEVALSRTVGYVLVAGVTVTAYLGALWLLGTAAGTRPAEVSLLVVALLAPMMLPLHAVLQRRVNRWVHGVEEEPWQELARLGEQLGAVADPDEMVHRVLPDVLRRVRRALRARTVRLRLVDGSELADGSAAVEGERTRTVTARLEYGGEQLGTLEVTRDGGFGEGERDLLHRWAGQAAVAVHTVLLAREARRSRELVVLTREEERRRLRRDLHDGVGPSLAALALQAETARDLAADDPRAAAGLLSTLAPRINEVVADVRSLVHELRPPTLDELGLAGATRELAARLSGSARIGVEAGELGALPAAVEVAAYRIAGEAVTNAVRHSGAGEIRVRLRREAGCLVVQVADDGSGLRGEHTARLRGEPTAGLGLGSMRHRSEELGGTLDVRSAGDGTTVTARLPLGEQDPVATTTTAGGGAR